MPILSKLRIRVFWLKVTIRQFFTEFSARSRSTYTRSEVGWSFCPSTPIKPHNDIFIQWYILRNMLWGEMEKTIDNNSLKSRKGKIKKGIETGYNALNHLILDFAICWIEIDVPCNGFTSIFGNVSVETFSAASLIWSSLRPLSWRSWAMERKDSRFSCQTSASPL